MEPTLVGDIVEAQCLAYLISKECVVSKPFSQRSKYDLILDKGGKLYKIQCKHARKDEAGFSVVTSYTKRKEGKMLQETYNDQEIDYFMTTYNSKFYIFENNKRQTRHFRLVPPKNCQKDKISMAKDYEADLMLQKM